MDQRFPPNVPMAGKEHSSDRFCFTPVRAEWIKGFGASGTGHKKAAVDKIGDTATGERAPQHWQKLTDQGWCRYSN